MKYNTIRKPLIFPEYGRCIQNMVDHILTLKTKEERTLAAQATIKAMQQVNPQANDCGDYLHKLYDHLFIMSDFKLDIDSPYPMPLPGNLQKTSKNIQYTPSSIRFKYYGKTLESMIRKAAEMEEGEERNAILNLITVQMKKSYYLWNDDFLSDELISNHLNIISNGKIQYTEEMKGEVYSNFFNKPSLERKNKFISVSPYETKSQRKPVHNNSGGTAARHNNNNKFKKRR